MKYFTIFLILCVLAYAGDNCKTKTQDSTRHCTKCDECDPDVCDTCEEGWAKVNYDSDDCTKCAAGYSLHENKCVKCDEHCTSGCETKGAGKCDSECQTGWGLVQDDNQGTKAYTCLECDGGCSSGCNARATLGKSDQCDSACTTLQYVFVADKFVCEKCDPNCADGCEGFDKSHQCTSKCVKRYTYVSGRDKDPCQACDEHCEQCDSKEAGAGKCDANGESNDYCDNGWVLNRSTMKCVACDPHCLDGCKVEGVNKCKSKCEDGYYYDSTSKTCKSCLTNCGKCDGAYDCDACKEGYYLIDATGDNKETQSNPDKCEKIDCKPVDPNCAICTGVNRNALKCTKCNTGYDFEDDIIYQKEEEDPRHRCVEIAKSITCQYSDETYRCADGEDYFELTVGECVNENLNTDKPYIHKLVKDGSNYKYCTYSEKDCQGDEKCEDVTNDIKEGCKLLIDYHRKDKCYTEHDLNTGSTYDYYHQYYKYVQNGADTMKCYYYDEDCIYRKQEQDEKTFTSCTKLDENKYILHDSKCSGHKMYKESTCKTEITFDSNKCFKIGNNQHVYITTEEADSYVQYYGEDCTGGDTDKSRIIYKDEECVKVNKEAKKEGEKSKTCVWPTEPSPSPDPTPDPVDTSCEVTNCSECSEDKKTCTKCATGYELKDNKCEKKDDGSKCPD